MAVMSKGTHIYQEKTGVSAFGQGGSLVYLDATNGADWNNGFSPREAKGTLAGAVALLEAGDTLVILAGGSETITAAVTIAVANVKISCPAGVANPRNGFALTGAGTLDLISITAADVVVEGIVTKHTGTTANQSGILIGAAAHRAVIRRCVVNDMEISLTKTGAGVEVTSGADDVCVEECTFLDTLYDVYVKESGANESDRPVIKDCTMYVGLPGGWGVYAPAATGKVQAPQVRDCLFIEADGDGSSATAAWDGSDGTNGTQGPIKFGAAVDQYLISGCRAYTALAQAFDTLNGINAGAAGDVVDCATGTGSDTSAAVTSVGTQVSQALSMATLGSTGASTAASVATLASTGASSAASSAVVANTGASTAASVATLASTGASTAASVATLANSGIVSYGTVGTSYHSSSLSMATKASTGASTAASSAVLASTGASTAASVATLASTGASTGASIATLASTGASTAASVATLASTGASSALSAAQSVGTVVAAVGKPLSKVGSMADNAIDNNTQSAGCLMATAVGDVYVENVVLEKDGTNLTGPTNVEISTDNAYGNTGVNDPVAVNVLAGLTANNTVSALGATAAMKPFVLENGKKMYLHGDDAAGASAGAVKYAVIGRALSAGGSIS